MFKLLTVTLLALSIGGYYTASVQSADDKNVVHLLHNSIPQSTPDIASKWINHIQDFIDLVDVDKILAIVFGYITEPEILNFATFIFSDEFKNVVVDFESMVEFEEAIKFLGDKGYPVDSIIDFINKELGLPSFVKPKTNIVKTGKGMMGLIEDIIAVLPMDEFKKLFKTKLETSPEVRELFDTINSPEFIDIMRRMSKNPKFEEIKITFEKYGFDFKYLCILAKDIFGEHYQGVFCG